MTSAAIAVSAAYEPRRLLSRVEAAKYAGVSPNTFDRMIEDGIMPVSLRVYSRVLWDVRALDAAIDALPREGEEIDSLGNEWDDES